jgi:hypothetical protein
MVQSSRGQEDGCVKVHSSHQEAREGEEALHVDKRQGGRGGADLLGELLLAGVALFCLGISLSFLATNSTTTTEVFSAPAGKALGDADGEALARLDKAPTSGLLTTTPGEEARDKEELSVRVSVLMSMLVVAASSFFTSGSVLVARNSSLRGGVSHSLGVRLGSQAGACGGASFLGVFLL